jgi:hypothetical protein
MTLAELWKYGMTRLTYWEGYHDGMSGRRPRSGVDTYLVGYRRGQADLELRSRS